MHPQITSNKPGKCPICSMDLVPVPVNTDEVKYSSGVIGGQAPVQMSGERQQLIGVKLARAEVRDLFKTLRASARVAYDPGLYSALLEHREAIQALKRSEGSGAKEFRDEAESLVKASKLRLRQMGLSDSQINQAADPGFDPSNLLLGTPGERVWIYVDIFADEARLVKPGQTVVLESTSLTGKHFEGRLRSIDTVVNPETRTLRARAEVANPKGELKPDMYLSAEIQTPIGKVLAIPETAVVDTGTRRIVYVQREPGVFDPREVTLGREAAGYYEVLGGLKEGETVVSSGNFLVDSESKIRGAAQ